MKYTNLLVGLSVIFLFLFVMPFVKVWAIVSAGSVGVVTRFGAVNRVVNPGLVFKLPLIEAITHMETRTQKEQVEAQAASKDLQEVKSTIALNYHLNPLKAVEVYQNIGADYVDRIIAPALQEAFKATTAKFTAEELIGQREQVKNVALAQLKERLEPSNIIVDNFNIVNFDFSKEFSQAIENKQVIAQQVEASKLTLQKIEIEATQASTQAKGQANAQKALKDIGALSPEYLQYLALTKWNGILPTVVGGAIPFINVK